MKKNIYSIFIVSLFLLLLFTNFLCTPNQKELNQIESRYKINLDEKKEKFVPLSIYFKSPKTIILETKKESLIGNINKLQVFDEYIYILDRRHAKSLFVFDLDGCFVRKIGGFGRGPGEYIQLSDFTLDTENRFIFLLDDISRRVIKYSLDGKHIQTFTLKVEGTTILSFQYYNNRLYISVLPFIPQKNDFMLIEVDVDKGSIHSKSLPYKYNKGWSEPIIMSKCFLSGLNTPPLYTQMFMDYIISFEEEITPYIEIISQNLVTKKDVENITIGSKNDIRALTSRFREYLRERSKIYNVHSYVENDKLIFFRYYQGMTNINTIIYDKNTGSAELINEYGKDLIFKNEENRFFSGFEFFDQRGAYEILQSLSIKSFQESIMNNETVFGLDKASELLKLDSESNPVIFYYEFK